MPRRGTSEATDRAAQGYLSDPEDEASLGSAEGIARAMTNEGERLFTVGCAVTLRAGSEDELRALEGRVRERLERLKIRPYGMRWRHFDGFRAAGVPYATDTLGMRTPLDTQTLARCFPWLTNPISTPTGPVWGLSEEDKGPVRFDPCLEQPGDGLPGSPPPASAAARGCGCWPPAGSCWASPGRPPGASPPWACPTPTRRPTPPASRRPRPSGSSPSGRAPRGCNTPAVGARM